MQHNLIANLVDYVYLAEHMSTGKETTALKFGSAVTVIKRSSLKFELPSISTTVRLSAPLKNPLVDGIQLQQVQRPSRSAAVHPAIVAPDDSLAALRKVSMLISQHAYRRN